MEDVAEDHPDNDVRAVSDRLITNGTSDGFASGEPREVDTSPSAWKTTPYMRPLEDIVEQPMKTYIPMWKQVRDCTKFPKSEKELERFILSEELAIEAWKKTAVKKELTHVALNSGSYSMTEEQEQRFLLFYAAAVSRNAVLYFTEVATKVMRLFVDLDFEQIRGIKDRDVHAATHVVHKTVCKFFDGDIRTIVSVGGYLIKLPKEDKPQMVKTGIHLHFNVFVDADMALDIRESILADLENTFGKRVHPNNSWRDVVDSTVYGSGKGTNMGKLRMMFAHKADVCPKCKNNKKTKSGCDRCNGNGRVHTGRPYFPHHVLGPDGSRDLEAEEKYRRDVHLVIKDTSIRTTLERIPDNPKYKKPEGAPVYIPSSGKTRTGHKNTDLGFTHPKDSSLNSSTKKSIYNSSAEWEAIEKIIHLDEKYAEVLVNTVTTNAQMNQYVVHVNGPNCRWCGNIQREHNSNRIFFVICADGISQRCHDNSDTPTDEMKFGLCSKYSVLLNKIPSHMVSVLFPKSSAAKIDEIVHDDEEQVLRPDKKTSRLLAIGDAICMSLYKMRWSTTLQMTTGEHFVSQANIARQSLKASIAFGDTKYMDLHAVDPCALGTKHRKALKELGFDTEPEHKVSKKQDLPVQSLSRISNKLFLQLKNAVELAAYLDPLIAMTALEQGFDGLICVRLSKRAKQPRLDYM